MSLLLRMSSQRRELESQTGIMIVFGLVSSVFDSHVWRFDLAQRYSRTISDGWFIDSILSATLIVLVVRTRVHFSEAIRANCLRSPRLLW